MVTSNGIRCLTHYPRHVHAFQRTQLRSSLATFTRCSLQNRQVLLSRNRAQHLSETSSPRSACSQGLYTYHALHDFTCTKCSSHNTHKVPQNTCVCMYGCVCMRERGGGGKTRRFHPTAVRYIPTRRNRSHENRMPRDATRRVLLRCARSIVRIAYIARQGTG